VKTRLGGRGQLSRVAVGLGLGVLVFVASACSSGSEPTGEAGTEPPSGSGAIGAIDGIAALNACERETAESDYASGSWTAQGILVIDSTHGGAGAPLSWMAPRGKEPVGWSWIAGSFTGTEAAGEDLSQGTVRAVFDVAEMLSGDFSVVAGQPIDVLLRREYYERALGVQDDGGRVALPVGPSEPQGHYYASGSASADELAIGIPMIAFLPSGVATPIGGGCSDGFRAEELVAAHARSEVATSKGLDTASYFTAVISGDPAAVADLAVTPSSSAPPATLWEDRDANSRPLDLAPKEVQATMGRATVFVTLHGSVWYADDWAYVCSYTSFGRGSCYSAVPSDAGKEVVDLSVQYDLEEGAVIAVYAGRGTSVETLSPVAELKVSAEDLAAGARLVGSESGELVIDVAAVSDDAAG